MAFKHPDVPDQLEAFREMLEWAADCKIFWKNQNESRMREANTVWGELHPRRFRILSSEVRQCETGDSDNPRKEVLCSSTEMDVQLKMRSRDQEHFQSAWYSALKAQQRVRHPYASTTWLKPFELAIATIGSVEDLPDGKLFDSRIEDVAILEYTMNSVMVDEDAAGVGTWIESIKASTGFKNTAGDLLDPSLQWDKEVIP